MEGEAPMERDARDKKARGRDKDAAAVRKGQNDKAHGIERASGPTAVRPGSQSKQHGSKPRTRKPNPRDTRRRGCAECPQQDICTAPTDAGEPCPLESDTFAELKKPEKIPKLVRDAIAAEFRTYFRAKRAEASKGDKIDGDASKMLQGLLKAVESYVDLVDRVQAGADPHKSGHADRLFPTLAAALAISGDGLFSEVRDEALRDRLRREYIEAVEREDTVLREALDASGLAEENPE